MFVYSYEYVFQKELLSKHFRYSPTSGSRFLKMYILVFSIMANNSGLSWEKISTYFNLDAVRFCDFEVYMATTGYDSNTIWYFKKPAQSIQPYFKMVKDSKLNDFKNKTSYPWRWSTRRIRVWSTRRIMVWSTNLWPKRSDLSDATLTVQTNSMCQCILPTKKKTLPNTYLGPFHVPNIFPLELQVLAKHHLVPCWICFLYILKREENISLKKLIQKVYSSIDNNNNNTNKTKTTITTTTNTNTKRTSITTLKIMTIQTTKAQQYTKSNWKVQYNNDNKNNINHNTIGGHNWCNS